MLLLPTPSPGLFIWATAVAFSRVILGIHYPGDTAAGAIRDWQSGLGDIPALDFPDVAARLAAWIAGGMRETPAELGQQLWQNRNYPKDRGSPLKAA